MMASENEKTGQASRPARAEPAAGSGEPLSEPPRLLRMLAALTFAFYLFNLVAYLKLLSEHQAPPGPRWFPVPFVLSCLVSLVGLLGVWLSRRVGLLVLALGATALNGVSLATHAWNPVQLLLPALVSLVGFSQVRKLR